MFVMYRLSPILRRRSEEEEDDGDDDLGDHEARIVIAELPREMRHPATQIWGKIADKVTVDLDQSVTYMDPPLKGSSLLLLFKSVLQNNPSNVPFDRRRFIRLILDNGAGEYLPSNVAKHFVASPSADDAPPNKKKKGND